MKTFNYHFIWNFVQQFFSYKADKAMVHKIINYFGMYNTFIREKSLSISLAATLSAKNENVKWNVKLTYIINEYGVC